jgi:membrane protease YdiL (CAAX protease family)
MQHTKTKASNIYLAAIIGVFIIGTIIDGVTLKEYGWAIGGLGAIMAAVTAIYCMYRFTNERVSFSSLIHLLRIVKPQLSTLGDRLFVCITLIATIAVPLVWSSGLQNSVTPQLFFYALSAAIIPPAIEELLNRGFIQTSLERLRYSSPVVIIVSSIIFSLSHYPTNPGVIPLTMVAGLVFGLITMRTKSVVIPLALHAAWNFMITILV